MRGAPVPAGSTNSGDLITDAARAYSMEPRALRMLKELSTRQMVPRSMQKAIDFYIVWRVRACGLGDINLPRAR